jgi:hypothetical protein
VLTEGQAFLEHILANTFLKFHFSQQKASLTYTKKQKRLDNQPFEFIEVC